MVMGHQIQAAPDGEAHIDFLTKIFPIDRHSALELDSESLLSILVIGEKVLTPPIIIQPNSVISKTSKNPSDLLEIVGLLLFCSEFVVRDLL